MDKKTAAILLDLNESDPFDAYESQLFKVRSYLLLNPVIPAVLYAKQKKIFQLMEAIGHFTSLDEEVSRFDLIPINGGSLFEKFICYEQNICIIKKDLSTHLSGLNINLGIDYLISNLSIWSNELKEIDTEKALTVPASHELNPLTTHKLFKSAKLNSAHTHDEKLLSEFKRIQLLSKSIKDESEDPFLP